VFACVSLVFSLFAGGPSAYDISCVSRHLDHLVGGSRWKIDDTRARAARSLRKTKLQLQAPPDRQTGIYLYMVKGGAASAKQNCNCKPRRTGIYLYMVKGECKQAPAGDSQR
jgi:hypothetical protein